MDLHDIEGLAEISEKQVYVKIEHNYTLQKSGWLVIEDDRGKQYILASMIVEEDGTCSFRVFEFTQRRTKKGHYAGYLPQIRDIAGYRDVPARREIIKYKVVGWEERKMG